MYAAFYDDYTKLTAFLHSHSYTGNPLACSAALATLDIFESDRVIERNRELAAKMGAAAAPLAAHPNVAEIRQTGMILAIELVRDPRSRTPFDWRERRGLRLYEYALSRGVLLRPLGNVVYWMPPYVLEDEQLELLADVTARGIGLACA
jgi:adenosylmethionine-8-amino-7-oxononanoate aminotransferase